MSKLDWSRLLGFPIGKKLGDISHILRKTSKTREERASIYKHNNFEDLARLVVSKIIDHKKWEPTKWTNDGNHDAYTIISCYNDGTSSEEWWLEAKYSVNSGANISRYRLDATIVSAILSNTFVSQIIFVTNLNIHHKTISEIKKAIEKSTNCKNVEFFTRDFLEFFLSENKNVLADFLDLGQEEINEFKIDTRFLSYSTAVIYSVLTQNLLFKEGENELIVGKEYCANFHVYSSKPQEIKIIEFTKCIKILSSKTILLNKGMNYLYVKFLIEKTTTNKLNKFFEIDNYVICSDTTLKIREQCFLYDFNFQQEIITAIKVCFNKNRASYHIITGNSSTGKTTVIELLLSQCNDASFYISFTNNKFDNIKFIVKVIKYLLFPFIPSNQLDYEYLHSLKNSENLSLLEWLASIVKIIDENNINEAMKLCDSFDEDFPQLLSNKRIVVLDNVHLLKNTEIILLLKLIDKLYDCKFPVHIVICGQKNLFINEQIRLVGFIEYKCELIHEEYEKNIKKYTALPQTTSLPFGHNIFTNIVELNEYLLFIKENSLCISDLQSFLVSYMHFSQSDYIKNIINPKEKA
jgi:uridine kinase